MFFIPEKLKNSVFRAKKQCTYNRILPYVAVTQPLVFAHVFRAFFVRRHFNFKITESQGLMINQNVTVVMYYPVIMTIRILFVI